MDFKQIVLENAKEFVTLLILLYFPHVSFFNVHDA
jgi:hypothetical protein